MKYFSEEKVDLMQDTYQITVKEECKPQHTRIEHGNNSSKIITQEELKLIRHNSQEIMQINLYQ